MYLKIYLIIKPPNLGKGYYTCKDILLKAW